MSGSANSSGDTPPVTPMQGCRWLLSLIRSAIRFFSWLSLAWLLLAALAVHWVGQHNPTPAFLLFLPSWLWSIPGLIMIAPALLFDTLRTGLPLLLALLCFLGPALGYELNFGSSAAQGSRTLKVMTYNRGQSQGTSLQPFKNQNQPDLLALQDSGGRAQSYLEADGYKEFSHGSSSGEFLLLSKFPILNTQPIVFNHPANKEGKVERTELGARFELDWVGTRIAVYNMHFPTHRGMLLSERNGGFLSGVLGIPGTPFAQKRHNREAYWEITLQQIRQVSDQIGRETIPVILVGDLNNPPFGPFHRTLCQHLVDGHSEAGHGYGYTFPGQTNNPLALFRPWLRIDYALHSKGHWETLRHEAEPSRTSQHRALFAEFSKVSR
ncbi:endonuclease/exonuclease/phosphatase family protein [Verrucomicrobium sp. BvORR106]|uniref:endonuclease/exonuclease/phosphatase family protein n=1 Tax=Verrucomicrobium sp. BvORR106 TaxID=1403819 RepID=UPI000570CF3D|nr:endonuclease/exonuclease/phosphatase family protein [Verrucomicrobium sp. BvORR106]